MAVAPPLPKSLEPGDMRWARWVTEQVQGHNNSLGTIKTNSAAAAQQAASAHTTVAAVREKTAAQEAVNPSLPVGPPQVPSAPTLTSDHGTVTIKWDGQVHATQSYTPQAGDDTGSLTSPAIGFNHVAAQRSTSANGPWDAVGGFIRAAGSLVDTDVVVGTTYYYTFETTDNAGAVSNPSVPSSILVVGVDLGSLEQDVTDAITAAADAAQAGQDAAAAAATAAATAQQGADSAAGQAASALQAAQTAQQRADDAYTAAENATGTTQIYIGTTQPTDTSGQLLWVDTTGGNNTPKHYVNGSWVAITDAAAVSAANAAAAAQTTANTAQTTANTAVTNAANAQSTANSALTTANGKNKVYYQTSQPGTTGNAVNDLWFDTDDGYRLYVWNGSAWTSSQLGGNAIASQAITASQLANGSVSATQLASSVNTSIGNAQSAATAAQTTANGKNSVDYSTSAPSNTANPGTNQGDLWFVQNASGQITAQYTWSGSAWISQSLTNSVIATLDAAKITTGTLAAARIGANSITANQMVTGTITAASGIIADAAITSAKISSVDAGSITSGSISSARIAAGTISASQMVSGTITAASGVLANASIVQANIANAAVGTAQIADLAVSDAKIATLTGSKIIAGSITTGKFQAGAITTNDIAAGSIDTNRLAAGAITADKLSLGAVSQQGSGTNRVPANVTDTTYWSKVVAGTTPGFSYRQATATTGGLVIAAGGSGGNRMSITAQRIPAPASGKINISITGSLADATYIYVPCTDANGNGTGTPGGGGTITLPANTAYYEVFIGQFNTAGVSSTITAATVFDVTGSSETTGQAAQLSPAGLQLFDANSNLAVDLTTNAQQYLSIVDNTQAEPQTVAAIDQYGNAAFTEVSTDNGLDIQGFLLTDTTDTDSLFNANPNGGAWNPNTPLLDRLARGVIYDVTWGSLNGYSVSSGKASLRIAQDSFILEDGRQYMINLHTGGLQIDNPLSNNIYLELQVSTTPIADINTGVNILRGVIYGYGGDSAAYGGNGTWPVQTPIFSASAAVSTIASSAGLNNRVLPANVPIYWQLDLSMSANPSASWSLSEFGYARGLTVIDLGANDIMRPNNGADNLPDVSNFVQIASGGSSSAGSGSAGTTGTSKTVTFTATSSRTWNQSGSNIVTGSGQYTNGASMYVGTGSTPMGSWFGNFKNSSGQSMASVLSGKTVTAASLTLKNNYTYSSNGSTNQFGTAATATAPSTIGAPTNNVFSASFAKGQTKSISLNSTIRGGLSSGGVQSFVIGVQSGTAGVYGYYAGATQSGPPKLTVTYH